MTRRPRGRVSNEAAAPKLAKFTLTDLWLAVSIPSVPQSLQLPPFELHEHHPLKQNGRSKTCTCKFRDPRRSGNLVVQKGKLCLESGDVKYYRNKAATVQETPASIQLSVCQELIRINTYQGGP